MTKKAPNFYVVGIGASAGGLDAIQTLFANLPDNTGMAFVIIQHLSPDFKSLMPELLSKYTNMPIYTAQDKQTIKPNCIYLNQRNKNLHIKGKELYLLDKGSRGTLNLPIDIFFHTLGEEFKEKAIGVILSGTGSDGSRGILTIKEAGGTIIVQDPATAQFDGMPNSSISTNVVDYINSPEKIGEIIHKNPMSRKILTKDFHKNSTNESLVNDILVIMHKYSGIDFREYKKNTLLRQIEKRMKINNIQHFFDYATFLSNDITEKQTLKEDFLIGVTRFFRETEAFAALKTKVIPELCKSKASGDTIRVWIPGCSTGEEVYSIAILIDDYIRVHRLNIDFKIFATDADPRALKVSSLGTYHRNIINEIEGPYLEQYFLITGDTVRTIKRIRKKIVFSNHNLINDPPFIRMDLISCRNLLIYFDNKIQKKVMFNFQFALNKFGFLFLGHSESLGEVSKFFKTIDVKWKLFQNISETKNVPFQHSSVEKFGSPSYKAPSIIKKEIKSYKNNENKDNPEFVFHKYLSEKFSPSLIFIDTNFNILFIKGDAGKRLSHNEGIFQNNLLKIVSTDIAVAIRNGVKRLEEGNQDIIIEGIVNKTNEQDFTFNLKFHKPAPNEDLAGSYILEFSDDERLKDKAPLVIQNNATNEVSNQRLEELEHELKVAKTQLQNAIEELETTNEELQSTNEELKASNEELQSTNEELQSVNEGLYTVNSEMQEKNTELTNLNNDVTNLLDNTQIATLFLDEDLRIRKFTPALKEIFDLHETDYGRSLSSFTSSFTEETRSTIIEDSKSVLKKLITIEKQVIDKNNNFYLKRISPFITATKSIDGVIITFVNINQLKEQEIKLAEKDKQYFKLFENLNESFIHAKIITNKKGEPIDWEYINVNPAYEKLVGLKANKIIGKKASIISPDLKNDPNKWIEKFFKTASTGKDQTIEGYFKPLNKYLFVNTFCPKLGEFAGTITDITAIKTHEQALIKSEAELKQVQKITKVGSWFLDLESNEVNWTTQLYNIIGFDPTLPPPTFPEQQKIFTETSWKKLTALVDKTSKTGEPYAIQLEIIKADGTNGWIKAYGEAVRDNSGKIVALRGAAQDITRQKQNEQELIKTKKAAEAANIHKNYFLANMSHEIRTPMNGVLGFSELLKNENLSREEQLKYLEIIDGNSKQLLTLIDDIIDVAKIEANEIKIINKECHVAHLINNLEITYNQLKTVQLKNEVVFKKHVPEKHKDLIIITDPQRLEQVISNLLNNGLKFSDKGEISFGFNVENEQIMFFVKDEGIGIPKNKQIEIFERFKQVNYNNNAKYGGTGLGLAICRGILNLLGGEITLSSKYNVGTLVEFNIPLKLTETKKELNTSKPVLRKDFLKNKTILIAEDDALVQLLFQVVLKKTGAILIFANNGKEAVDAYINNPDISVILLDIRMPKMNGITAMGKILKINPEAKIIMQTAYAMPEEREKCFNKGCIDFLSKPIIKEELFNSLNKWVD